MKLFFITVIPLLGLIATVAATNYCSSTICGSGGPHIGCGNTGAFSSACPAGKTTMVTISSALKSKILASHNTKRNTIANGQLAGFQAAQRMPTMQWNDELALLASYNVKTCKFAHDKCRNTDAFKYSGQNLAKFWWSGSTYTDEAIILKQIDDWWAEYKDTTMSQINKYPASTSKQIGHFTVMAADKNIALGCAAIRFPENGMNSFTLACNYATTNMINNSIYKAGTTASKCATGRNSIYSGLCSASEVIDVNNFS